MTDANGGLKVVFRKTIQIEPLQIKSTAAKAVTNTDNTYQMGQDVIGTSNMLGSSDTNVKLVVNGYYSYTNFILC